MEMMAAEGSSEEWVQTEIAQQLEQLSLEDLEEEETATENGAHSPPSSQVPHRLGAINLYANPQKCSASSSPRARSFFVSSVGVVSLALLHSRGKDELVT